MNRVSPGMVSDARDRSAGNDERELKFVVDAARVELARRWLDTICRRDLEYPAAYVWTIYYDTPGLTSLGEKINSDYLKLKVRLRWYSDLTLAPSGPAFIEAKMREGTVREKVRVPVPYPAEELARWTLDDSRLLPLASLLRSRGILLHDLWRPVLLVRYRRDRFVEPIDRARVSFDTEIAAVKVNRAVISTRDSSALGLSILEAKSTDDELPAALGPLLHLGARKRSFSKYLAVYAHTTRSIA